MKRQRRDKRLNIYGVGDVTSRRLLNGELINTFCYALSDRDALS